MASTPFKYPPRLDLARLPTPLHLLPRASERWGEGKRIWIKRDDLTGTTLTGNKVRKLEFIAAHALKEGFKVLVTCGGIQSNHCRATALVAAQLGLQCHLVLRDGGETLTGNYLLSEMAGATLEILPSKDWLTKLNDVYQRLASDFLIAGTPALMIPTGGSDSLGIWGYIAAAEELGKDMLAQNISRALVATATGSAGTQTGLTAGVAILDLPVNVRGYAVCDDSEWFNKRVREDWAASVIRWPQLPKIQLQPVTLDHTVGPGYGHATKDVYRTIFELARLEGVVLDPVYTGKAFHGLITDIASGELDAESDVIFLHTGGVFGTFSHEAPMREVTTNFSRKI